jgi:glycosyltransferase involved in cell wall biosynthesis
VNILIAAASLASNLSGVQRHAFNLARCLLPQPEISELHVVVAPWQRNLAGAAGLRRDVRLATHVASTAQGSLPRNLWYYYGLPKLAAQLQVDLVHLTYPMPINAAAFHCPTVLTLHDLYPYEIPLNFGVPKFIFNRMLLRQSLRNADAIACVSETTSSRLRQYASPSVWRKAIRIYNCVEAEPLAARVSPIPGWMGEPFLLVIAQHRRNKNIPLLIGSFDLLLRSDQIKPNSKLVIVGIHGPESNKINRLLSASGLLNCVHLLEGISEQELQWCYRNCDVLVSPSITEGFGLPIAEGLLAGCRIVCSDIPAHREVGDEHCRFFALKQNAIEPLAEAITAALREPKTPPIPLPQFSASVLARQYVALYRRLIGSAANVSKVRSSDSIDHAATATVSVSASTHQPALQFKRK